MSTLRELAICRGKQLTTNGLQTLFDDGSSLKQLKYVDLSHCDDIDLDGVRDGVTDDVVKTLCYW